MSNILTARLNDSEEEDVQAILRVMSMLASTRSDAARLALSRLGAEARMLETRQQLLDEWAQRSGRQPDPEVMADMVERYNL